MSRLAQQVREAERANWPASAPASSASPPAPVAGGLLARILPGMAGRGHGLETLCLYLAIARTALLDFIVALGLPTPHDRAHRRAGGRTPWLVQDIPVFIVLWMDGWQAASLAERFGRSRGSIWSKARQLGLPRRERRALFRPADPHAPVPAAATSAHPAENFIVGVRAFEPAPTGADFRCLTIVASEGAATTPAEADASNSAVAVSFTSLAPVSVVQPGPSAGLAIVATEGAATTPAEADAPNSAVAATFTSLAPVSVLQPGPSAGLAIVASEGATTTQPEADAPNSAVAVAPTFQAPPSIALAGALALRPAKQAVAPSDNAVPSTPVSTLASAAALPVEGLTFDPPLLAVLRPTAILRKGLRREVPWKGNVALDDEVASRTWAGHHYKKAAEAMGISIATFLSRRFRLEVPRMPRNEWVDEYNEEWAAPMIEAYGYKKVQCRGYKAHGVEFWFWCKKSETRWYSKLVRSTAWFRDDMVTASSGF